MGARNTHVKPAWRLARGLACWVVLVSQDEVSKVDQGLAVVAEEDVDGDGEGDGEGEGEDPEPASADRRLPLLAPVTAEMKDCKVEGTGEDEVCVCCCRPELSTLSTAAARAFCVALLAAAVCRMLELLSAGRPK